MDAATNGGIVFEEMLHLPPMEQVEGLERLLKVLGAYTTSVGLRPSSAVGRGHHILPAALLSLVPFVVVALGQSEVIAAISTTEVADGLGLATEVGMDCLLTGGVLGGDVQELPRCAQVSRPSVWTSAS